MNEIEFSEFLSDFILALKECNKSVNECTKSIKECTSTIRCFNANVRSGDVVPSSVIRLSEVEVGSRVVGGV